MYTFPMNYNIAQFHMPVRYLLDSVLPIFDISLLHFWLLTFDKHVAVSLELLEWLHWHYSFT
jgi:hypothetical protein